MKNYIKPDITFQKMNLSTDISTGCAVSSTQDPKKCPVDIPGQPGLTIYTEGSECIAYGPGWEEQICYHVPVADLNVFES